jgi:hypothetical protein
MLIRRAVAIAILAIIGAIIVIPGIFDAAGFGDVPVGQEHNTLILGLIILGVAILFAVILVFFARKSSKW